MVGTLVPYQFPVDIPNKVATQMALVRLNESENKAKHHESRKSIRS